MEADESMGEDARSIAYFDMYVTPVCFPFWFHVFSPRLRGLTEPELFL